MKLKKRVRTTIAIILILTIVAIAGLFVYKELKGNGKSNVEEVKVLDKLDKYGYSLKESKSNEYKEMFKELKEILNEEKVDEEKYLKKISEMFVYDFFSLEDKTAKTDVGGVEFVYKGALDTFLKTAQNTYYKYVENNIYGERDQKLPVVSNIVIETTFQQEYAYPNNTDEKAYFVPISWSYTDQAFSSYQKSATLIFVHDENKLSLVELQM